MSATDIPSPCISVCYLDTQRDVCVGCYRSRAEIGEWSRADAARRAEIVASCTARRAALATPSTDAPSR
ncbi:DUF1289 domain-containing protein [Minwuia sp.]|uniref:DUF1289 domain-containing protein n=1 Tax=Minwuia sp. TaxID=2493630 RepID=UPI003A8FE106